MTMLHLDLLPIRLPTHASDSTRAYFRGVEPLCITRYGACMTMLSFRVSDAEAAEAQLWAQRLGVDRSELLRDALHRHLVRLRAEMEVESWQTTPLTDDESAFAEIADWGPAEDWSDWADAAR